MSDIAEVGRSYCDSRQVVSLQDEMFKLRRIYRGKEKEEYTFRRMHEKTAEEYKAKGWKEEAMREEKDARERHHQESEFGQFADAIDGILKTCNIEVPEQFLLKSEIKNGNVWRKPA